MLNNFLLIPFSLRSIVVTAMLLFVGNVSFSQVRPDQAPTKSPADTDEIYTQYLGVLNRIKFSDAKVYFQSGLSLSWNSATNELTIGGGNTVDISSLNTDNQQLTRSGMVLSLDDGGSVDLSPLFSGIDDQTLSFNSATGELTIQDGNTVDLSPLESDGSETKVNAGTNVTITGSGTIADPYVVNASGGESTQVADLTALAASSFDVGTLVWVQDIGKEYIIKSSSYSDFTEDDLTVEQISNSNYAVINDDGGVYYLSDFGITNNIADTTSNTTALQRAINFAANKKLVSDIDTFQITSSGGSIAITNSIDIDFAQSRIKVYPETATHIVNDIFEVQHSSRNIDLEIKGGKFWGATALGFALDGTNNPSLLLNSDAAFLDTEGSNSYSAFVKMDSVTFLGLQPLGVQINSGYSSTLYISNCVLEASRTNALAAFGARRKVYAYNNKIYGASYNATDILSGQSFGVSVYFHPYIEVLEYKNNEHFGWYSINANTARSFQFSSGSAVEETTWPNQEDYPVQYQEITGNVFNVGSSDEKAIVSNWWYPKGVYKQNVFLNDGNAYQLVAPCTIEGDYFSSDVNTAILFSFPPLNRDLVHIYEFNNLDIYSNKAVTFDKDENVSPIRGLVNITGGKINCSNTTFDIQNLSSLQDSSRIDLNIKSVHIVSNSANAVLGNTSNLFSRIEGCFLEVSNSSARMFSITSNLTAPYGRMSFKQNTFLNPEDLTNPLFFYVDNSEDNDEINNVPIIYEDNVWPNEDNLGYIYRENNQSVRIPLSTGIYYDTLSTATVQLNWNYNTYYIDNSTLSAAYVGRNTPIDGITDPARLVGGDVTMIFTQSCTLDETGNFDLINSSVTAQAGERCTFNFDPISKKWVQVTMLKSDVSSSGGGGSTQVADLTALAASSFPVGTLVTVQSNGAIYKISAPESTNGDLVLTDASSNSAKLQPNALGEIVASHLSSIDRDVLQDIENYCEAEGYKGVYIDIASFTIDHTLDGQDIEISTDFSIRGLGENKTTLNITPLTPSNHNYNVFVLDSDIKFEISDMNIIGANTNTQTGTNPENSAQTVLISTTLSSGESGQMLLNNMTIDAEYYYTISIASGSADATTFYDVLITNVDNYNNFGGGLGYFNTNASTGNCSLTIKSSTWDGMGITSAENNGIGAWSHALYLHPNIQTIIEDCIISNTARFGLNVRSTSVTESANKFSIENTIFSECAEGAINIEETIALFSNCRFINSRLSANERGGLFVQNSTFYEDSDNRSVISVGNDMQITLLGNTFKYIPPAAPTQPIIQSTNSGTVTILGNTFNTDVTNSVNIIDLNNASLTSSIMNNTINAPTHTGTAISINLGSHSVAFNAYDGLGNVQQINNGSTTPPTLEISNSLFQEVPAASATDILFSTKKALFFSADNSGLGIEDMYTANVNSGFTRTIGSTGLRWISAADGSQKGQFFIKTANGSSVTEKFSIDNLGTFKFNEYGQGSFEDSDLTKTESAFVLVPATDGTILEKPISELGGSYTFSSLQTSDFTVAIGEYNLVDPNGGAITATVPSGVTQVGTEFWVVDSEGTASGTNTITVDFSTNGYTVSGQNTAVINAAGGGFKFIYIGNNKFIKESL